MSSVSSTSCLHGVLIVDSDEAMKSASRPGSRCCWRSVCRSSDSSGDSEHDLLEVRLDVARERVDFEAVGVVGVLDGGADVARRYGCVDTICSSFRRARPLDDQPEAAVGQLEHLVDVRRRADAKRSSCVRLLDRRVALREDRDQLAVGDRIVDQPNGASRAPPASGKNEFGKRTVSRSGRIGSSDGMVSGRSPIETSSAGGFSS
jgi:hypothetical protein